MQGQYTAQYPQAQYQQAQFSGGKGDKGKGAKGGKGGKGDSVRRRALDKPQISRCPMLRGPFAPEAQRIDNRNECGHCKEAGVQAFHSGSWECDMQFWAPRAKFSKGGLWAGGMSPCCQGCNRRSSHHHHPRSYRGAACTMLR